MPTSRIVCPLAICAAVVAAPHTGHATCIEEDETGCVTCCAPGGDCSTTCPSSGASWSHREQGSLEVSAGVVLTATGANDLDYGPSFAIEINRGFAPANRHVLFGNVVGVELSVRHSAEAKRADVEIRPTLRTVRQSRWRTNSVIGALLPGAGVSVTSGSAKAVVSWHPAAIDLLVAKGVAIHFDPIALTLSTEVRLGTSVAIRGIF